MFFKSTVEIFCFWALASRTSYAFSGTFISVSDRFRRFSDYCRDSQKQIIASLEIEDSKGKFQFDPWERFGNDDSSEKIVSQGITAVIQGGSFIEKGAVSTTFASGRLSKERSAALSSRRSKWKGKVEPNSPYFAAAISVVLHSKSPMVPTFRADVRYFELADGVSWFGGGADLTPYYLFDEDVSFFHSIYRDICARHTLSTGQTIDKRTPPILQNATSVPNEREMKSTSKSRRNEFYTVCKQACDDYFFIPTRGEHRGVGGIFFDDLNSLDEWKAGPSRGKALDPPSYQYTLRERESRLSDIHEVHEQFPNELPPEESHSSGAGIEDAMEFTRDVCNSFMNSYLPIVRKRRAMPYTEQQRHWQLLRRGRYVEFNLLYDRGVRFGLAPGGRTEAVLVSCPPLVAWDYQHSPAEGSEEARLLEVLRHPREW